MTTPEVPTETAPLPTAERHVPRVTQQDTTSAEGAVRALEAAGAVLPADAIEIIAKASAGARSAELDRMGAAYIAVCLFASDLSTRARAVLEGARPHPHGKEPRVVIFKQEMDALAAVTPSAFIVPALAHAERLTREIASLQASRRQADSAQCALRRIAADLGEAVASPDLDRLLKLAEAAEAARDLAFTELKQVADVGGSVPTESEMASCYYPVQPGDPSRVRKGDILFHPESKQVLYRHDAPGEAVPPEQGAAEVVAKLGKAGSGLVLLRPYGAQAVLALRVKMTMTRVRALASLEGALKGALHQGRADGAMLAGEMLAAPSWGLPPLIDKAREA